MENLGGVRHAARRPAPPVSDVLGRSTTLKLVLLPPARRMTPALTAEATGAHIHAGHRCELYQMSQPAKTYAAA